MVPSAVVTMAARRYWRKSATVRRRAVRSRAALGAHQPRCGQRSGLLRFDALGEATA
jgi:hypothetical protein